MEEKNKKKKKKEKNKIYRKNEYKTMKDGYSRKNTVGCTYL